MALFLMSSAEGGYQIGGYVTGGREVTGSPASGVPEKPNSKYTPSGSTVSSPCCLV